MAPSGKAARTAKHARRVAAKEARRQEHQRLEARRRRRTFAIGGGVAAVVLVIVAAVAWSFLRPQARPEGAGGGAPAANPTAVGGGAKPAPRVETYPNQGAQHIPLGQAHPAYNSNPPTSGWHTAQTAQWGVFRREIPDEILIHNLEHGGIWISYKDPNDTKLVEQLEALVSRYRSKVILAPRPKNDSPVVVAAWTHLLKLDGYDERRIEDFIKAYKNRGPEQVPD